MSILSRFDICKMGSQHEKVEPEEIGSMDSFPIAPFSFAGPFMGSRVIAVFPEY
jgi:hypothetical protein